MRESASTDLREPQGSNPLGPPGPNTLSPEYPAEIGLVSPEYPRYERAATCFSVGEHHAR